MRFVVGVAALVVLAAGCGGDDSKPLIAAGKTAVVRGEIVPDVHLFGEPVVAHVDVILNREKADPADVRLKTDFEPYEPVGETREQRRDIGDYTVMLHDGHCLSQFASRERPRRRPWPVRPCPVYPRPAADEKSSSAAGSPGAGCGSEGQDARTRHLVTASLALAHQLVRLECRRAGLPVRRDGDAAAGAGLPDLADAARPRPARAGARPARDPGLSRVGPPAPSRRADLGGRAAPEPTRAGAATRRVGEPPTSVDERVSLEALAFELGREQDGHTARRAREQGWSPPTPEPESMTELVASIREESDAPAS